MPSYAQQVAATKLYKQFDHLVNVGEVTAEDVEQLKATVLKITDTIGPHLDRIRDTFEQYTEHDLRHLCNVADLIYKFLPKSNATSTGAAQPTCIQLNALELTLLWLGVLLHDIGMYVQPREKSVICKSTEYSAFLRQEDNRVNAANQSRNNGRELNARIIEDSLFAEFIRRSHACRVRDYLESSPSCKATLHFRDLSLMDDVVRICESHAWGVLESTDARDATKAVRCLDANRNYYGIRVNLQYLACCLRIGDVLDFDRSRTPLSVYEHIDFTEEISKQEWKKHLSVHGWHIDERSVSYSAECEDPVSYLAVHSFLDAVDHELRDCRFLVDETPYEDHLSYSLNLAHVVDRRRVRMKDRRFAAGGFRFQLEYEEILDLLMDKSLYPSPALFIRELLQNSLDACVFQYAIADSVGMGDKYTPRIVFWDNSDDPDDPRITIVDNGVGMSRRIIEHFFMRVGKSYYRSAEFRSEQSRLRDGGRVVGATSQFGIGFLSCFLASNHIEVSTYCYGHQPLHVDITGRSKYFVVQQLDSPQNEVRYLSPDDEHEDGPPQYSGTKITVHLKANWLPSNHTGCDDIVYNTVSTYAVNQSIEVVVYRGSDRRSILPSRWETEPPIDLRFFNGDDGSHWKGAKAVLKPAVVSLSSIASDYELRGSLAQWLLDDGANGVTPARGAFLMNVDSVEVSNEELMFLAEVTSWISRGTALNAVISFLEAELNTNASDNEFVERLGRSGLVKWSSAVIDHNWQSYRVAGFAQQWLDIIPSNRPMVLEALYSNVLVAVNQLTSEGIEWHQDAEVSKLLLEGNIRGIIDARRNKNEFLGLNGLQFSYTLQLSSHGIRLPGGIMPLNIATMDDESSFPAIDYLPDIASARIDIVGLNCPKPAAHRQNIPIERAGGLLDLFGRLLLSNGKRLVEQYGSTPIWNAWFVLLANGRGITDKAKIAEWATIVDFIRLPRIASGRTKQTSLADILADYPRWAPVAVYSNQAFKHITDGVDFSALPFSIPTRSRSSTVEADMTFLREIVNGDALSILSEA